MPPHRVAAGAGPINRPGAEPEPFLRGIAGSGMLLLMASLIEHLFFGEGAFAKLSEHPFWIVVLLAALQNGVFVGVATAGLATLMLDWPPRPIGVDITVHYVQLAILPLQWLVAALCIGLFRQTQIRSQARLTEENLHLHEMNDALATEMLRTDKALRQAQFDAVTRSGGARDPSPLLAAMAAMMTAPRAALEARFEALAPLACAAPATLLVAGGGGRLKGPPMQGLSLPLVWGHPLIMAALAQQGDTPQAITVEARSFTVAAVRSGGSGALFGVVIVAATDPQARTACGTMALAVTAALRIGAVSRPPMAPAINGAAADRPEPEA